MEASGAPTSSGWVVQPVDANAHHLGPALTVPLGSSMSSSSVVGAPMITAAVVQHARADTPVEAVDLAFDISWDDITRTANIGAVDAHLVAVGVELQRSRDTVG